MGSGCIHEMEKLHTKLFKASTQGSIDSLQELLVEDPLILDRAVVNCFNETPLHVAAMLGHIDFVKEIIRLKPKLVNELNSQRSSPLHLASAKGHVDVVRALLSADHQQACKTPDTEGHTPLHLAAAKGRVEAMKLLLEEQPEVARLKVYGGETNILHLCVKHNQLEALKILVEGVCESPEFINSKDDDGNTVLHLAVADKQVETTKFLVSVGAVEVNAVNNEGMTAMDILIQSRRDMRDSAIKKSLKHGRGRRKNSSKHDNLEKQHWLEEQKSSLMIVAILIATMAFQVGVHPPGGVWQQDDTSSIPIQRAGYSVLAYNHPRGYIRFYIVNTIAFVASLTIILFLISGLPLIRGRFMWILTVIIWVAITAVAWCYALAVAAVTPSFSDAMIQIIDMGRMAVIMTKRMPYAWIILMLFIIIANTIRMIPKLIKKLRKLFRRRSIAAASPRINGNDIIIAI